MHTHRSWVLIIVEVNDKWTKIKVTMCSGSAFRAMPEEMFPGVKVRRNNAPKRFVAANGEHIRDMGEKPIPLKTNEEETQYDVQKRKRREASCSNS